MWGLVLGAGCDFVHGSQRIGQWRLDFGRISPGGKRVVHIGSLSPWGAKGFLEWGAN